jgi:glyoxylase-like metal-dependent hydrolase (beta-lactamase superfamily II)
MFFRQLFDPDSSTYSYVLGDPTTRAAAVIDPVRERVDELLAALADGDLQLEWALETHTHADHVTGGGLLRERTGARMAVHHLANACSCADRSLSDGDVLRAGALEMTCLETPGHTPDGMSFYLPAERMVFTGDTLLIGTCGRTDFQGGDAGALYDAIHGKLFTLPDEVLVYPAHDYKCCAHSTIGRERRENARAAGRSRGEFIQLMGSLNLPPPKKIAEAVPANARCGLDGTPHGA